MARKKKEELTRKERIAEMERAIKDMERLVG